MRMTMRSYLTLLYVFSIMLNVTKKDIQGWSSQLSLLVVFFYYLIFEVAFNRENTQFLSFKPMADSDSSSRIRSDRNGNTKSDYTEIVVIRHGETEWNAYHKIQGQLNIELNGIGRKQAAAVAQRLSFEHKISAVYSSDLNRAFETALIIANTFGGLEVIRDLDLRDRHMGDIQGLTFSQASKINPKAYQAFKSREINQEIPGGGESFGQLFQRSKSSLERIGNKHRGERVVVVTHCAVIEALHVRARPHEKPGRLPNACLNVFRLFANGEWIIEAWADVTHLNQMGFSE